MSDTLNLTGVSPVTLTIDLIKGTEDLGYGTTYTVRHGLDTTLVSSTTYENAKAATVVALKAAGVAPEAYVIALQPDSLAHAFSGRFGDLEAGKI
jgi:hypothetical protein